MQRDRQAAVLRGRDDLRSHAHERIEHAPHRPLAQAGVAIEGRRDRRAGDGAEHQAAAGSGIAEIEHARRLRETGNADTMDIPYPFALALDAGPEHAHGFAGIEHVLAF